MKTITVGIPVYNHEQYLADAIQSVLDQTHPCEILVCNDGSTDASGEVAKRFGVKVIDQENQGLPTARNTLIAACKTEYIFFLDSDDILQDDCIEKVLQTIESTEADVVAPSIKEFGERNGTIILMPTPQIGDFLQGNRIGYCAAIRVETLKEVGGYNPNMKWGYEDFDLWFNLLKRGKKIVTIPEPLVLYRTKKESMLTVAQQHHDELMAQIRTNHPEIQW